MDTNLKFKLPKENKMLDTEYATINTPELFFGLLFQCRDYLHLAHLKTTSYAQHKALNEAYDGILDLIDGLIESYQGLYGLVKIEINKTTVYEEPVEYIKELYNQIDKSRSIFKESFIQNQIDEIQQLNASTLYKLINLK